MSVSVMLFSECYAAEPVEQRDGEDKVVVLLKNEEQSPRIYSLGGEQRKLPVTPTPDTVPLAPRDDSTACSSRCL